MVARVEPGDLLPLGGEGFIGKVRGQAIDRRRVSAGASKIIFRDIATVG